MGGLVLLLLVVALAVAGIRGPKRGQRLSSPSPSPSNTYPPDGSPAAVAPTERFVGVILARAAIDVAARFEGRIGAMHVRLGDHVPTGGLIATLDAPSIRFDLEIAEAVFNAAQVEQEKAGIELAEAEERLSRRRSLSAAALISAEDLAAARFQQKLALARSAAARAAIAEKRSRVAALHRSWADTEIRAPFDGVIAVRYLDAGANVTMATPIVRLISAQDIFVRFAVPENQSNFLKIELPVQVSAADLTLRGTIDRIAPEIDAASRMVVVEARLDAGSASRPVLSGEIADVSLEERR